MTENGAPRTKRMSARFFKNPPQPHMCIRDSLQGSIDPCYINVLSWDKIAMGTYPLDRMPLYGGVKINPPRTEKPDVVVFFVMANPEILRVNGKTASDPKEQSMLIELLLDFIEAMNEGVQFMREYIILNDRDITGELKEIWMVVQSDRVKAQNKLESEEARKPVPQYPHYQDQSQEQQQSLSPSPQNHLHQHQLQNQQQNDESTSQLPPKVNFEQKNGENENYYAQNYHNQNTIQQQSGRVFEYQQIPNPRLASYQYRKFPSNDQMSSSAQNNQPPQVVFSKNYTSQYQQIPRQVVPFGALNVNQPTIDRPITLADYGLYPIMNDNPENNVYVKVHKMQQPQQPQIQIAPPWMSIEEFYKQQANMYSNYIAESQQNQQSPTDYCWQNDVKNSQSVYREHRRKRRTSSPNRIKDCVDDIQKNASEDLDCSEIFVDFPEKSDDDDDDEDDNDDDVSSGVKIVQVTDLDEDTEQKKLDWKKSQLLERLRKKVIENRDSKINDVENGEKYEAENSDEGMNETPSINNRDKIMDEKILEDGKNDCMEEVMKPVGSEATAESSQEKVNGQAKNPASGNGVYEVIYNSESQSKKGARRYNIANCTNFD